MFEIKKEPSMDWINLLAGLSVYMGLLLFLISLHIITISSSGDVFTILNATFIVFLWVYIGAAVFGVVGIVIHLLRWLTWKTTTPEWQQKEVRRYKQ